MEKADRETAEEMIGYALGRANTSTLKEVKHGDDARSRNARRYLAKQIVDYIKVRGYAVIRVRPPLVSHSTGPGVKPEPGERPSSRRSEPD